MIRQLPPSSLYRSSTRAVSLGTTPVTARCSCSRAMRLDRAASSRPAAARRSRRAGLAPTSAEAARPAVSAGSAVSGPAPSTASSLAAAGPPVTVRDARAPPSGAPSGPGPSGSPAAASRRKAPLAAPVAAGRPGPSPLQKGRRELRPGAGSTTTRSAPISRTRQPVVPSVTMSPTAVSLTISSSSSPMRRRPPSRAPSGRTTGNMPRSGMVPEAVTARRWAPGRAVSTPVPGSRTRRGAKSLRSAQA